MSTMVRWTAIALAVAAAFAGLDLAHPGWVQDLGPALVGLYELRDCLDQEDQRTEDLEAAAAKVWAQVQARRQVGADLIDRRLTLAEAVARFRELGQHMSPHECEIFRRVFPGCCDEERYWRQAVAVATSELGGQPWKAEEVLTRLRAELQQHLTR